MPIRNEWLEAKASGYRPVRVGRRQAMPWVVGIIGALVVIGGIWAWANYGTLAAPGTSQVETARTLDELRASQVLAGSYFELVPGEVVRQPHEEGSRFWIRLQARNLDQQRTLQEPYWDLSVKGFNAKGEEVNARISIPSGAWTLPPEKHSERSVLVIGDRSIESLAVTVTYNEPGRTASSASFVWPYGR